MGSGILTMYSQGKEVLPVGARIESLEVKNYRSLRDVKLSDIGPLTVLVGRNGSGKSTVFDVFAFLSECFGGGLRNAWDRRGRLKELRSRDAGGPVEFLLKYREGRDRLLTYNVAIDERDDKPFVAREQLRWTRGQQGRPFDFLKFEGGKGSVVEGDPSDPGVTRTEESLDSPMLFAVNTFGQLTRHPRVSSLRRFITSWHLSYVTPDRARYVPEAGPQEHLSQTGDNLANVIQYLKENHPQLLERIVAQLTRRVPRLEQVLTQPLPDGRLLLQVKDAPFTEPVLSKFASDGTLKMLAYLTLLHDPQPFSLVGIEEPENHLHPDLLEGLAEECRAASTRTQLLVTTHSPAFVDALQAREVWVLDRAKTGYVRAVRAAAIPGVNEMMSEGARLGQLWREGYLCPTDDGGQ